MRLALSPSLPVVPSRAPQAAARRRAASLRGAWFASVSFAFLAALGATNPAWADAASARNAIARGDCQAAGDAVNDGLGKNDPDAYFLAGFLYDQGGCVTADPARAVRLYEKAASLGSPDAKASLGLMAGLGRGVPQDYAAAHRLFHGDKPTACEAGASPETVAAIGYAETVSRLAWRKVSYPLTANEKGLEASLDAVLSPDDGSVALAHVHVDEETGSRLPRTHDFTEQVQTAYRDAIAQAPKPAASGAMSKIVAPWYFAMPRNSENRKTRMEGTVTLGDVCPVH